MSQTRNNGNFPQCLINQCFLKFAKYNQEYVIILKVKGRKWHFSGLIN